MDYSDMACLEISEPMDFEVGCARIALATMTGEDHSAVEINDALLSVAMDHLDEVADFLSNPA